MKPPVASRGAAVRRRADVSFRGATPQATTILLVTVVAACAGAPARAPATAVPTAPALPAAVVLEPDAVDALAELLRMEDERTLEPARVRELLQAPEPFVRGRAALAAGRIGDPAAAPLLRTSLQDPAAEVRSQAAFALGELGDTSAVSVTALASAIRDDTAAVAGEAAHALGKLHTAEAWSALASLLVPISRPAEPLLRQALLAIWRHPRQPGTLAAVLPWTGDASPAIRWSAAYALTRVSAAPAIPRLRELLGDPDAAVRAIAARGLRPGAVDSAGSRAEVRAALQAALQDEHPHVRINGARALAAFREPADGDALRALLTDPDANVRLATLESLAMLPSAAVALTLAAAVRDVGQPLALRAAALASLARTDTTAALPVVGEWASGSDWLQRLYAARALAPLRIARSQALLERLARDSDPRVQGEAFGALAAADTTAPLGALFLEGLAAPDPIVRAGAATGLARRGDPAFLSALMQAYDRARQDTINDAALAALDALAALARHGTPVAAPFFLRFPRSPDPIVRARVASHFGSGEGTWGDSRPTAATRTPDFYRERVRALVAPIAAGAPEPRIVIRTARGDITLALAAADAPLTVHNFIELVRSGFYERARPRWHRVVPNFVLQDGDPRGDGSGGPPYSIRDEINRLRYDRGVLGMALSGPDTGGSQFFITHSPQPHLDGGYTVFGRVIAGMDVADAIVQDDAILGIEVLP